MNQQQVIDRLIVLASQGKSFPGLQSGLFRMIADLVQEGITNGKTYDTRFFPSDVRQEIVERDHCTCVYCNRVGSIIADPDNNPWCIDHVVPYSKGGLTCADNAVLSCGECNSLKGDKTPAQLVKLLRFIPDAGCAPTSLASVDGYNSLGQFVSPLLPAAPRIKPERDATIDEACLILDLWNTGEYSLSSLSDAVFGERNTRRNNRIRSAIVLAQGHNEIADKQGRQSDDSIK